MKRVLKLLLFVFVILLSSTSAFSAVEIFTQYDTNIQIHANETMDIEKYIVLQNIHVVGIVPGRVEFKIPKNAEGSVSEVNLQNFRALDQYGKEIKSQVFETDEATVIALDIFTPVLPGFRYPIELDYTLSYDTSGFFFKNLQLPVREQTNIDIEKGNFTMTLPEGKTFTFLQYDGNVTIDGRTATVLIGKNTPESVKFEYSSIPVRFGGIKGSYLFWILINVVLLIILAFEIRREIKRYHKGSRKHHHH